MVAWQPWSADVFARAARERKPVLLSISAAWCRACHDMDRTTYADPAVAATINDRFVPVRVDADCRPDINERYNLGGWPTTAFLTPLGALMTGGTFVSVERMPGVLARVAEAFAAADFKAVDDEPSAQAGRPLSDDELIESIFSTYDDEHGGFGIEPKFPHAAPIALAIALFEATGDDHWRTITERTLDAMANGGLWDARAEGFYRYATTRDWQLPHEEKLLETNAALLGVYAEAARVFGRSVDRERAAAAARFITRTLRADGGGYHGSDGDTILFVDANASAATALLAAAAVLKDDDLAREALESFERVLLACYKRSEERRVGKECRSRWSPYH